MCNRWWEGGRRKIYVHENEFLVKGTAKTTKTSHIFSATMTRRVGTYIVFPFFPFFIFHFFKYDINL